MSDNPAGAPALPERRVQRVRHELVRRELEVLRVAPLGASFVSVVLGGPQLAGYTSLSFDDHSKLFFPDAQGGMAGRDFTPRRHDAARNELTLEFALHAHGPASDWARQARPGDRLLLGGPRGSMIVPADYDWHLLVGDLTALPAIARRLEELPAGARAIVIAAAAEPADRRRFQSAARVDLTWVDSSAAMVAALGALALPPGEGYAWCAGEAADMAALRRVLLEEKRHPLAASKVAAYWKVGAVAHHEVQ